MKTDSTITGTVQLVHFVKSGKIMLHLAASTHFLSWLGKVDKKQPCQHETKPDKTKCPVIHLKKFTEHALGSVRRQEPRDAFDNQDNAQNNDQGFRKHKPYQL